MQRRLYTSALIVLQLWIVLTQGQVPLSNFFPYGILDEDSKLPQKDDGSYPISIPFDFPFFDSTYRVVYLSTNGQINFGSDDSSWVPRPFPSVNCRSIASYWTDSHPSRGGDIQYLASEEAIILTKATQEIRSHFAEHQTFSSSWVFIVTFDQVSAYGCGIGGSTCSTPCSQTLAYQTALTSNGTQSFAIIYFNSLKYTAGTANCTVYSQVGFNAGDGVRFYTVPTSSTPYISQYLLTCSNVGVPGKWIFSTNSFGASVPPTCFNPPTTTTTSTRTTTSSGDKPSTTISSAYNLAPMTSPMILIALDAIIYCAI